VNKEGLSILSNSFWRASLIVAGLNLETMLFTASLSSGGVSITLIPLMPDSAIWSVLGIGVADRVRTSTFSLIAFNFSL